MSAMDNLKTRWVGKAVYKRSGKPFQNGSHTAIVTGIGEHPITHHPAYSLEGCEGVVEVRICTPLVPDPTPYTQQYLDRLDAGGGVGAIQGELSREIQALDSAEITSDNDNRRVALSALESSLNKMMQTNIHPATTK